MRISLRCVIGGALALAAGLLPVSTLAAEEAAGEQVKVGYDRGFYIKTEKFSLTLGGRVQFRFTQIDLDGADEDADSVGSFTIPRARLTLGGHFYKPTILYFLQYDLRGESVVTSVSADDDDASGGLEEGEVSAVRKREPDLRDFWLEFTKYNAAQLRVGQFKVPFGNQELTSSGAQQFVDRSVASEEFAPSRDQGLMLFGRSRGKKFGYMAGVFNGNGRNQSGNDNEAYRYAARVNFDPHGEYKLEESAVDAPERVNWTIGAAWTQSADDAAGEIDAATGNLFFGLKYRPVSVTAEWFSRTVDDPAGDVDSDGYIVQAGLFVVPKKMEVAIRRSEVDPNTDVEDDELEETRAALNWFWLKHNYKLQLDYGILRFNPNSPDIGTRPNLDAGEEADDKEFRAQLQFRF
jgi:phosphate-selective porin